MSVGFWSSLLTALGDIIIGISVIRVHGKVVKQHKLDAEVWEEMRHERWWAIAGIVLIVIGFLLEWLM